MNVAPVESAAALRAHYDALRARLRPVAARPIVIPPRPAPRKAEGRTRYPRPIGPIQPASVFLRSYPHPIGPLLPVRSPSVRFITDTVAMVYGVSADDIRGRRRFKTLVEPRHVTFYLCSRLTKRSSVAIAEQFGRDHTTVLHGIWKVSAQLRNDEGLSSKVGAIMALIEARS